MERDDINESRRSFSLGSGNGTNNSSFSDDNSASANDPLKRTRLDGMNLPHLGTDSYSTHSHHFLQEHSVSASYQAKQQCLWSNMFDGDHRSGFNHMSTINKRDSVPSPCEGLVRHHDIDNTGDQVKRSVVGLAMHNGFDLPQTSNSAGCSSSSSSVPHIPSSTQTSNSAGCRNSRVLVPPAATCTGIGCIIGASPQLDGGEQINNFSTLLEKSPDSGRGKACVSSDHYREPHRFIRNCTDGFRIDRADGMSGSSSTSSNHGVSILPSQVEKEHKSVHPINFGCSLISQSENSRPDERKNDHKRKLSMIELVGLSPRQNSQSTGWSSESHQDAMGGRRSLRPHSSGSGSLMNISITNDPMVQIWDNFSDNRTALSSANLSIQHTNNINDIGSNSGGRSDSFLQPSEDHPVLRFEDPNHSQLGSLFGRNVDQSMAAPNSHNLYSRDTSYIEQQIPESVNLTDIFNCQPSLCSNSSSTSLNLATRGAINHYNRGDIAAPRYFVRERPPNVNDVNQTNGISNRVSRGVRRALLDNGVAISDQIPNAAAARMTNMSEARGHGNNLLCNQRSDVENENRIFLPPPPLPAPGIVTSGRLPRTISSGPHSGSRGSLFVDGRNEAIPRARIQNILGLPLPNSRMPYGDRRRLLSEILSTLEQASRNEDINFEELVMFDPPFAYRGVDVRDQHSDMRLDVDNMSYEELLALEEQIGSVSTGLSGEMISKCLSESKYSSLDATLATLSQESDIKCTVCQEEFVEEDDVGRLDCGHGYHTNCIRQWLLLKNICPICKAPAYSK